MIRSTWLRVSLACAVVAMLVWLAVSFTGPKPAPPERSSSATTARTSERSPAALSPSAPFGAAPAPMPSSRTPTAPRESEENPPIARIVPVPAAPSAQPPLPKARPPGAPAVPPPPAAPLTPEQAAASRSDLESVRNMIRDFRSIAGENPIGTNAEIMRQLMGENKKNANLGPPEGLNLNNNGELVDRWGTPFFFHQLSKFDMEIRSAGPDRVMWTEDDLVTK